MNSTSKKCILCSLILIIIILLLYYAFIEYNYINNSNKNNYFENFQNKKNRKRFKPRKYDHTDPKDNILNSFNSTCNMGVGLCAKDQANLGDVNYNKPDHAKNFSDSAKRYSLIGPQIGTVKDSHNSNFKIGTGAGATDQASTGLVSKDSANRFYDPHSHQTRYLSLTDLDKIMNSNVGGGSSYASNILENKDKSD